MKFLTEIFNQIFWTQSHRPGKLTLTSYATNKMYQQQLDTDTLKDTFRYGVETKIENGFKIVRKYANYSVGIYYIYDPAEDEYVITTCWKGGV